ncbi:MAG: sigma-70 family RNA polymerase sigma factor [Fimbriiglobus sp.]
MSQVTELLGAAQLGDGQAASRLFPLVYNELRKLAAARMANEGAGHTLQPTALVHEAYLRLLGDQQFDSRGHFFTAAAEAMRRILIDHARHKLTTKQGGNWQRIDLHDTHRLLESPEALVDLDDTLSRFAALEPEKAKLVELRFFCGMTVLEAAEILGISPASAARWWEFARLWLYVEMAKDGNSENP